MEEIGAAVQVIELSADVAFKTVGLTQEMIEMLINVIQYMQNQELMKGGSASLENVIKKDGSLHVFQFPEAEKARVIDALEKYKISYHIAMDLNVNDGKAEVFVSGADLDRVSLIVEKLKLGEVKDTGAWLGEADPEMKDFFSNDPEKEVPETAMEMEGKENTAFVRFPVSQEPMVNFSINQDSIYKGIKNDCHVIRIPGTWRKEGGPYYVHIPKEYAKTAVVDNQKTLLLRLPNNVKCRVTSESGMEEWRTPRDIHRLGFSDADRRVKRYTDQKNRNRSQEKIRQKAYQQQKKKHRY